MMIMISMVIDQHDLIQWYWSVWLPWLSWSVWSSTWDHRHDQGRSGCPWSPPALSWSAWGWRPWAAASPPGCCCPRSVPAARDPPCSKCPRREERTRPQELEIRQMVQRRVLSELARMMGCWCWPKCLLQAAQRKHSKWKILFLALITKSLVPKDRVHFSHLVPNSLQWSKSLYISRAAWIAYSIT